MRQFAAQNDEETVGLVLVDSSHPEQYRRLLAAIPPASPGDGESMQFSRDWFSAAGTDSTLDPALFLPGSLGDKPLIALTAASKERGGDLPPAVNAEFKRVWVEPQRELALVSTCGDHILAEESAHFIQQDQPELVVAAILRVIEQVCVGQP